MILYTDSIQQNNLTEWSTRISAKCGDEELGEAFSNYGILAEELEAAFANYSILALGTSSMGFFAYLGFLFSGSQAPDLATKNINLSFAQRMSWLLTWLVTTVPIFAFKVLADVSSYSLLTRMLLGDFLFYGYLLFMAFGVSERLSFNFGLLESAAKRPTKTLLSAADSSWTSTLVSPELTVITIDSG